MDDKGKHKPVLASKKERAEKLASALRDNLRRRKASARPAARQTGDVRGKTT